MNHFHRACLRNERVSRGKKMATIFHNVFKNVTCARTVNASTI